MGWISDIITNISAFRIKVGEKLNLLNANKADTTGNYPNLNVGNADLADNATKWGGLFYAGTSPVANIEGILVKETGFINAWVTDKNSIRDWLDLSAYAQLSQVYTQSQALALFVGLNGVQTIADTKTYTSSPIVPNGTLAGHTVNLGQLLGFGYQNASQVTAIVNSAVSGIPAPGNGSVIIQGVNALTGTATFSMNQSNNVVGSFDLTIQTKADIQSGVEVKTRFEGFFQDVPKYYKYTDVRSGGLHGTRGAFVNLFNPVDPGISVNVEDHYVHGARLILQGVDSGGVTYNGNFFSRNQTTTTFVELTQQNKEYSWDTAIGAWREVF